MNEEWRDIAGYEGFYQVSNIGLVRSVDRKIKTPVPHMDALFQKEKKGQIIKPYECRNGYMYVNLWKEGTKRKYTVHRLVACAFLQADPSKNQVNHIDHDKKNNRVSNLEWTTAKENINHSAELMSKAHLYKNNGNPEMLYIRKTPCGTYRLYIPRLKYSRNFKSLAEAFEAREVIIGDEKHLTA